MNGKNKSIAVNNWVVSLLRYGAGILKWNTGELKSLERPKVYDNARSGTLHPKSDIVRAGPILEN